MYQFNRSSLKITSYCLHNYGQLGDLIILGGSLTSLKQNSVQLYRMIATITDIQVLYRSIELMRTMYNPHCL